MRIEIGALKFNKISFSKSCNQNRAKQDSVPSPLAPGSDEYIKPSPDLNESVLNDVTFLSKNTISSLKTAIKYIASKAPKSLMPAYSVYAASGLFSDNETTMADFTHAERSGVHRWSLSLILDAAKRLDDVQKFYLNEKIKKYADFMSSEDYKLYVTSNNDVSLEDRQKFKNCLDICDFMLFGFSITPNSQIFSNSGIWEEIDFINNSETGFYGEVFENRSKKELIIAYCGTDDLRDATVDDLEMMLDEVPDQYSDALELYLFYATHPRYADYKITITGHSLGGSLAQLVGATRDVAYNDNAPTIVTFNAFGVCDIVEKNIDKCDFLAYDILSDISVCNFITEGDFVSCVTRHPGKTILINNQSPVPHMTTSLHLAISPEDYNLEQGLLSALKEKISSFLHSVFGR